MIFPPHCLSPKSKQIREGLSELALTVWALTTYNTPRNVIPSKPPRFSFCNLVDSEKKLSGFPNSTPKTFFDTFKNKKKKIWLARLNIFGSSCCSISQNEKEAMLAHQNALLLFLLGVFHTCKTFRSGFCHMPTSSIYLFFSTRFLFGRF